MIEQRLPRTEAVLTAVITTALATVISTVIATASTLGCGASNDSKTGATAAATQTKAADGGETSAASAQPSADGPHDDSGAKNNSGAEIDRLLAWLDPDAVAAAAVRLPEGMDPEALVAVFAIPPRGEKLLTAVAKVDAWLPNFVAEDTPPSDWLGEQALVMVSAFSSGPTVIRPLVKPRAEVEAILAAGEFKMQTIEGFSIYYPNRSFPYRVAILDEHAVAFIPAREPGSGLSPLTAGRDLPASDLQRQIETAFKETPDLFVEMFAAGPMMHFDLDPPLVGARFELLPWQSGGIEGRVLLQPEREAAASMARLEAREPVGETDRIKALAGNVAYQLDGDFVLGVLRLPSADVKALGGPQ